MNAIFFGLILSITYQILTHDNYSRYRCYMVGLISGGVPWLMIGGELGWLVGLGVFGITTITTAARTAINIFLDNEPWDRAYTRLLVIENILLAIILLLTYYDI